MKSLCPPAAEVHSAVGKQKKEDTLYDNNRRRFSQAHLKLLCIR